MTSLVLLAGADFGGSRHPSPSAKHAGGGPTAASPLVPITSDNWTLSDGGGSTRWPRRWPEARTELTPPSPLERRPPAVKPVPLGCRTGFGYGLRILRHGAVADCP